MIDGYVHVIAGLAVCSRAADVWTTYLVSPTLKLEANPVARRFGWKFALLTVFVGLVAYASPPMGVALLTTSFLVASSNASKIVMAKAMGEEQLAAFSRRQTPPTRRQQLYQKSTAARVVPARSQRALRATSSWRPMTALN